MKFLTFVLALAFSGHVFAVELIDCPKKVQDKVTDKGPVRMVVLQSNQNKCVELTEYVAK